MDPTELVSQPFLFYFITGLERCVRINSINFFIHFYWTMGIVQEFLTVHCAPLLEPYRTGISGVFPGQFTHG